MRTKATMTLMIAVAKALPTIAWGLVMMNLLDHVHIDSANPPGWPRGFATPLGSGHRAEGRDGPDPGRGQADDGSQQARHEHIGEGSSVFSVSNVIAVFIVGLL